ncbi:MAG: hypothetical protein R3E64_13925 [Halioglobus sp.]
MPSWTDLLRHAYSRYLAVKPEIEASLPSRGGVTVPLTKEDFSSKGNNLPQTQAQFDHLVNLPDGEDRARSRYRRYGYYRG